MTNLDPERFATVRRIAECAFELEGEPREQYLFEACDGDPSLREEVDAILTADKSGPELAGLMRPELAALASAADAPAAEGTRIGPFTVRRMIGVGGMGTVYEAEQDEPRRTVALKTLGAGLFDPEAVSRFRIESEVLARLEHPGIAAIYEAGTHQLASGDGSIAFPYFAMEFVRGARTLVEYADSQELALPDKLLLFEQVCEAVHHGHLHGVIHRDLKPANVLVDESGRPKVIDFGVARASDLDSSMRTQTGQLVGTLQYMSPEQVEGRPQSIDARSDVYSLGVILFELLAGETPYSLADMTLTEAIRTIAERTPRRLRGLAPALPGELDWITTKALDGERDRRYASAHELARDIERFLANEPVIAGPPSTVYRVRKFVRRNRIGVTVAGLFLTTLIGSLVFVLLGLQRETAQRRRAEASSEFLNSIFDSVNPEQHGVGVSLVTVLDEAAFRLEEAPPEEPLVHADARFAIGNAFGNLARYDKALHHMSIAAGIRERQLDANDPDLARTLSVYAKALSMNNDNEQAEQVAERALGAYLRIEGEASYAVLDLSCLLATIRMHLDRPKEALATIERACRQNPPSLEAPKFSAIRTLSTLALVLEVNSEPEGQRRAFHASVGVRARLSAVDHPALPRGSVDLTETDIFSDDPHVAIDVMLAVLEKVDREALESGRNRALADVIKEANNFCHYYLSWGNPERARVLFERLLSPARRLQGEDGDLVGNARLGLGTAFLRLNRPDLAEAQYRATLESRLRLLGSEHHQTYLARIHLIDALEPLGDYEALEMQLAKLIEDIDHRPPFSHTALPDLLTQRGVALRLLERFDETEIVLIKAWEINQSERPEHHNAVWPAIELVRLYRAWEKPEEAFAWDAKIPERFKKRKP